MSTKSKRSILFLGKYEDDHCARAIDFVNNNFSDVLVCVGQWGDPLPEQAAKWRGDYIISYLSRWVIPERLIKNAKIAAINFHPASPDYPGIGCNNFALYDEAEEYGVTCHHMAPQVDTGKIIAVKRFPIFPSDNVASLLQRTYAYQLVLFYEIINLVFNNRVLPLSTDRWTRNPFSREEFDRLFNIEPTMSSEEINRRIRATSYGMFQPRVTINGNIFEYQSAHEG
jgi:methionyl-tRNA formyltransferase